jgi:hypothetical protein
MVSLTRSEFALPGQVIKHASLCLQPSSIQLRNLEKGNVRSVAVVSVPHCDPIGVVHIQPEILKCGLDAWKADQANRALLQLLEDVARCNNSARLAEPRKGACTGRNADLAVLFDLEKSDAEVANGPGK